MQAIKLVSKKFNPTFVGNQKRFMSSGLSYEESVAEANKWKKITYCAIPVCLAFGAYLFSGGEHHHHRNTSYSYTNLRNKEFPWGKCDLFDGECWKQEALENN